MGLQQFASGAVVGGGSCRINGAGAQGGEAAGAVCCIGVVIVAGQCLADCGEVVAHQCHIGAGIEGGLDAVAGIGNALRACHVKVVADDGAVETELTQCGNVQGRVPGGAVVDVGIDDVRGHQCFDAAGDVVPEGVEVGFAFGRAARVVRQGVVRVAAHTPVPGVVFADGGHAALTQAAPQGIGENGDDGRIGVIGTLADNGGNGRGEIKVGGEAEIDAVLAQFAGDNDTCRLGQPAGEQWTAVKAAAKGGGGGDGGKTVAETLHASAFVINAEQQVGARSADGGAELVQLIRRSVIAAEQNDARAGGLADLCALVRLQMCSLNADDNRAHVPPLNKWRDFITAAGASCFARAVRICGVILCLTVLGFSCLMRVLSKAK